PLSVPYSAHLSSISLAITRRPPTSTLFPYTTLFRSHDVPSERPQQRGDEAVGVGHVVEVEGIGRRNPRDDAHLLDAERDQDAPAEVEQLDGEEQHPQRDRLVEPLRREADAIVAHEHGVPWPYAPPS